MIIIKNFERLLTVTDMQELERELLSACKKGDLDTVRRLSREVAVSDVRENLEYSLLYYAVRLVDNTFLRFEIANRYIFNA